MARWKVARQAHSVAEDCRARIGEVPLERPSGPTVASTQYAMLAAFPGRWTQEDVLFASSPQVRGRHNLSDQNLEGLRQEYVAQAAETL